MRLFLAFPLSIFFIQSKRAKFHSCIHCVLPGFIHRKTHATGNDIPEQETAAERPAGEQRFPQGDGTAPGNSPEPAVHPVEHRHVRRLQEPVVDVEAASGADTAVRGLLPVSVILRLI